MNMLLHGVGCRNKGAELMLCAIIEHIRSKTAGIRLISSYWESHEDSVRHGLWRLFETTRLRNRLFHQLLQTRLFRQYGIVASHEIDAVLDASGFGFGDQWCHLNVRSTCEFLLRFARAGKKLIMLPQAFGPFTRPEIREPCRELLQSAVLVYARDQESFEHVKSLLISDATLRLAPDFTNLLEGAVPMSVMTSDIERRVCFLPNQKMVEKHGEETGRAYIRFLAHAWRYLARRGVESFTLFQQDNDEELLPLLENEVKQPLSVVRETDPILIKGIIGTSRFVIGSRFHGLVSALSQGVPCLGTSWSHKYEALFADYGCSECLLKDLDRFDQLEARIDRFTDQTSVASIVSQLRDASERQKDRSRLMWEEVDQMLLLNDSSHVQSEKLPRAPYIGRELS
jgi:polysaccharide pyruvyl transferase WcaK-like protein